MSDFGNEEPASQIAHPRGCTTNPGSEFQRRLCPGAGRLPAGQGGGKGRNNGGM